MCPRSSTARVMSMLRYIPRRSSRSSPASFTCCSVSTGSASRTAMWAHPFLGDGRPGLYRLARRVDPRLATGRTVRFGSAMAKAKRNWIQEERRRTLGDWVAFCPSCGHVVRYFEDLEDGAAAACPQCETELVARCPSCDARLPSAFQVECEECGAPLRRERALRRPDPPRRRARARRVGDARPWRPEARLRRPGGQASGVRCAAQKEGAGGGTMGFPTLRTSSRRSARSGSP